MSMSLHNLLTPEHWLRSAECARAVAAATSDCELANVMLRVARGYDQLAESVRRIDGSIPDSSW
jgi:hypothetical protein